MPPTDIHSPAQLRHWFQRSGVANPLRTCLGPLPATGAAVVRWSDQLPDLTIQTVSPHPDSYRIAVMFEPLESQIWMGEHPIWGGMIAANRFRICAPGTSNRWRRLSGCDIANVFIPIDTVEAFGRQRGDERAGTVLASTLFVPDRQVLDLVGKMVEAESLAGPLAASFCDSLVQALLGYLLEHYAGPPAPAEPGGLSAARLRRVKEHMARHLAEEIPVATLAQLCAMSEAHFSREFRRGAGMPPHQYLMKLRLERAREALLAGEQPITDIAGDCGFNHASHFSRAFAQRYGMPPANYRREQRCKR